MEFFARVFETLADWSSKLPAVEFKTYFIVVLAIIAGAGIITGLTYFGSAAYKLKKADKKIIKYLANTDCIDDDNASDFTAQCFSSKAPQRLRDAWVQYLGVRYGYPSDIVSERDVFDREVKKAGNLRANIFIGIALILLAIFAFWGFGTLKSNEMGVLHCLGLLFAGVIYLVLVIIGKRQYKKTLENFYEMQEDLDAKVNLQVEKNYATDSSPLIELGAMVDEIIARNTAKIVEISDEMNGTKIYDTEDDGYVSVLDEVRDAEVAETPIEELIAKEEQEERSEEKASEDESIPFAQTDAEEYAAGERDAEIPENPIAEADARNDAKPAADVYEDETVQENPVTETEENEDKDETIIEIAENEVDDAVPEYADEAENNDSVGETESVSEELDVNETAEEPTADAQTEDENIPVVTYNGEPLPPELFDALRLGIELGDKPIGISSIQRRQRQGWPKAAKIYDMMDDMGFLTPVDETGDRKRVNITEEELAALMNGEEVFRVAVVREETADAESDTADEDVSIYEDEAEEDESGEEEASDDYPDVWASAFAPRKRKTKKSAEEAVKETADTEAAAEENPDTESAENARDEKENDNADIENAPVEGGVVKDEAEQSEDVFSNMASAAEEDVLEESQAADHALAETEEYDYTQLQETEDEVLNDEDNKEIEDAEADSAPDDTVYNGEVDTEMFGKKKNQQSNRAETPEMPVNDDLYVEAELINDEDDYVEAEIIEDIEVSAQPQESLTITSVETADESPKEEASVETENREFSEKAADAEGEEEESDEISEISESESSEENVSEDEDEAAETLEITEDEAEETDEVEYSDEESSEEVVYIVEGPEEDDEIVKPAKLVKLPHLVDYMIAMNMSKGMKIKVATLLLSTYNAFKDSPEDKAIVIRCMAKLLATFK